MAGSQTDQQPGQTEHQAESSTDKFAEHKD